MPTRRPPPRPICSECGRLKLDEQIAPTLSRGAFHLLHDAAHYASQRGSDHTEVSDVERAVHAHGWINRGMGSRESGR